MKVQRKKQDKITVSLIIKIFVGLILTLVLVTSSLLQKILKRNEELGSANNNGKSLSVMDEEKKNKQVGQEEEKDIDVKPWVVDKRFDASMTGSVGGAWSAETHLSSYGFNVDYGLMEVLESSCRDIENSHIPDGEGKWHQYTSSDSLHPLNGWWVPPANQRSINCKVLEVGCGVGVYVDMFKKELAKKHRKVFGIEPNPMGGTFKRGKGGPEQLVLDILSYDGDITELAKSISEEKLGGEYFDLIYSIEVFEHMPLDRHDDAVKFLAALAHDGTKLIFGSASKGQKGIGHIGGRSKSDWENIMAKHGFIKSDQETALATGMMEEYNHRVNTNVYYYVAGSTTSQN